MEESLLEEDELDARGIRVVAIGQDVWLEGEVPSTTMYDLAERIAGQVGGMATLTNNLSTADAPYDMSSHRDGMDLRGEPSTDFTADGLMEARIDPFDGEEWDGASPLEGAEAGGPVGGDSGEPGHPMDLDEVSPFAGDILGAEEPWRYQRDGPNASLDVEPVLPPNEDEV